MAKKLDKNKTKSRPVSIGGQAVMEGVMMRGESSMVTVVRDADGIIRVEAKRIKPTKEKNLFFRLPIIRGVLSFINSLFGGVSVLMASAEVYGEDEPSKFEKWLAKVFKVNIIDIICGLALVLGLGLAVVLFIWLPQFVRGLLETLFKTNFNVWGDNFIEGGLKILIFVTYILLCSLMKDVKRTFMYHGAEHKTIACYESGAELTVENVKKCSRVHDRCGTTFMVFVMIISILTFACFESLVGASIQGIIRVLCKLALLPLVAGLSYELLKGLSKTKSPIVFPLKVPGLLLQRITTSEPDEQMIEVAITAFNKVLAMDADKSIPECKFVCPEKCNKLTERVIGTLADNGIKERSEGEWIVSLVSGIKRSELYTEKLVNAKFVERINEILAERITGKPLWYCIGDVDFYGYNIKVDQRALIPRPETELLVENSLKYVNSESKVLDLCTGSGAIAIAISKSKNCSVTAIDLSEDALSLAKENATINNSDVCFIKSDMFDALQTEKFDVIVSNPPYVKSSDIFNLQREVKDFEPIMALDGGKDGLDFYRLIALKCKDYLRQDGVILLEIGFDQGESVKNLFEGFKSVEIIKDYENNDRIIKAVL